MKVVGFCGPSGVGKTTLIAALLPLLKAHGHRVSVIKHAHKRFDIDHTGKDTYRHREAGAFEVLIASAHRMAKVREFEVVGQPGVHQLIAELVDCDWVLIEGFKSADLPKIELWRAGLDGRALYLDDPFVFALATDDAASLPQPTLRPVFPMNDPAALAQWLTDTADRFDYLPERHG